MVLPLMSTDVPYTLAHLSDVHLGPLPMLPLGLVNAKRLAGTINWYRKRQHIHKPEIANAIARDVLAQRPDHIAVTGDLANIGIPAEIARSATWLAALGSGTDVSVIPGNHDIYSTVRGQRLGAATLAPWRPHFTSCAAGQRFAGSEAFPFVRILKRGDIQIALIGLNSAVETPPVVATGALGARQLAAFTDVLQATRREGFVRVVLIHHPPLPGLSKPRHELIDAPELAAVLSAHGAELVLHGHEHRRMINAAAGPNGPVPVIGVASASTARAYREDPLASAHLYEFRRGAGGRVSITLVIRGLAAAPGPISELARMEL
jgi:3',5'-cyclic AMP phosphodiesterase CpdA